MSPVRSDAASASYGLSTVTTCSRAWRASSDAIASGKICVRPSGSAPTRTLPCSVPSLAAMSGPMLRSSASTRLK